MYGTRLGNCHLRRLPSCCDAPGSAERSGCARPAGQVVTPRDHMRAGHLPEFARLADTDETHEVLQCVLVRPACALVVDVVEPLELGRHVGQALKSNSGEQSRCRPRRGRGQPRNRDRQEAWLTRRTAAAIAAARTRASAKMLTIPPVAIKSSRVAAASCNAGSRFPCRRSGSSA